MSGFLVESLYGPDHFLTWLERDYDGDYKVVFFQETNEEPDQAYASAPTGVSIETFLLPYWWGFAW